MTGCDKTREVHPSWLLRIVSTPHEFIQALQQMGGWRRAIEIAGHSIEMSAGGHSQQERIDDRSSDVRHAPIATKFQSAAK
jgi:hypothetical protein